MSQKDNSIPIHSQHPQSASTTQNETFDDSDHARQARQLASPSKAIKTDKQILDARINTPNQNGCTQSKEIII